MFFDFEMSGQKRLSAEKTTLKFDSDRMLTIDGYNFHCIFD